MFSLIKSKFFKMSLAKVTSAAVGFVSAQSSSSSFFVTVMLLAVIVSHCASARQFQPKVDMFYFSLIYSQFKKIHQIFFVCFFSAGFLFFQEGTSDLSSRHHSHKFCELKKDIVYIS